VVWCVIDRTKSMLHPVQQEQGAVYHCISRVVNREFVLKGEEKTKFVELMRLYEAFCGVHVLTYCVMSNHFHILLEVPPRPDVADLSDEWILTKLSMIYSEKVVAEARYWLETYAGYALEEDATEEVLIEYHELREKYLKRMWDMGEFMKVLKQRFTQWYNAVHKRKGTLWEQRYKSVIVESGEAARVMAAYIDLNPVRAHMVQNPKDYRWCGYAEALAGVEPIQGAGKMARKGICQLMRRVDIDQRGETIHSKDLHSYGWRSVVNRYRVMLFEEAGIEEEQSQESLPELLRQKVRYFIDGGVIGRKEFVDAVFTQSREWFGPKRLSGARKMRGFLEGSETMSWYVARDLRSP